jgi:hypothetical protein
MMRIETQFYYVQNPRVTIHQEEYEGCRITVVCRWGDWKMRPDAYRNGITICIPRESEPG